MMRLPTYGQLVRHETAARQGPPPRWQELFPIGRGGMGSVWAAVCTDSELPRFVAIKRLRSNDPIAQALFLDEARISSAIQSRFLVQTLEHGRDQRGYFLAMELLLGHSLRELCAPGRERVPIEICTAIFYDALRGLRDLHAARGDDGDDLQIVHRDISPGNVFVTYEGQTKLLDFGITSSRLQQRTTCAQQVRGKWGYIAPERLLGENANPRSDVWSLGVAFWEALASRRLFPVKSIAEIGHAIHAAPIPHLGHEGVPDRLWKIVEKALSRDPTKRWRAGEMLIALETCGVPMQNPAELLCKRFAREREAMLHRLSSQRSSSQRSTAAPTLILPATPDPLVDPSRPAVGRPSVGAPGGSVQRTPAAPTLPPQRFAPPPNDELGWPSWTPDSMRLLSWAIILLCVGLLTLVLTSPPESPNVEVVVAPPSRTSMLSR